MACDCSNTKPAQDAPHEGARLRSVCATELRPKLEQLVFIAIGAGSTCWTDLQKAGGFDSEAAVKFGNECVEEILDLLARERLV